MFYLIRTPWWLKKLYPLCTWDLPAKGNTVYLSFDDGPHPEATTFVLDQLLGFGFKATFFCIGKNVVANPLIFNRVKAEGHTVGNHTMTHANGWKTSDSDYLQQMIQTDHLTHSNFFRPPYGRIKKSQIRLFRSERPGMKIIMWNILSGDFDLSLDGEQCYQNVIRHIRPGQVIVFHDSLKALPRLKVALPKLLLWLREHGYSSVGL